jgi:ribosome maturation factor RimP
MELAVLKEELRPAIETAGYVLYDIGFRKERGSLVLSVVIDRSEGISIDDCVAVSDILNPLLDRLDPVAGDYSLEVTSPGAERRLRDAAEIAAATGRFVHVVHDGVKTEGTIESSSPEEIILKVGSKRIAISMATVTLIRLAIKF